MSDEINIKEMPEDEILELMQEDLYDGYADEVVNEVNELLSRKMTPYDILTNGLVAGMDVVGELYSTGDYFLPDLILGGEAMKAALATLEPALKASGQAREVLGVVVLGSVKGDIHEIGKSLVGSMLSANGFEVYDLGIDIEADEFVTKAREHNADIVALSALLTTTMLHQRDVIELLAEAGFRDRVKVMVGGSPVTQGWADQIGADGYAAAARDTRVDIHRGRFACLEFVNRRRAGVHTFPFTAAAVIIHRDGNLGTLPGFNSHWQPSFVTACK